LLAAVVLLLGVPLAYRLMPPVVPEDGDMMVAWADCFTVSYYDDGEDGLCMDAVLRNRNLPVITVSWDDNVTRHTLRVRRWWRRGYVEFGIEHRKLVSLRQCSVFGTADMEITQEREEIAETLLKTMERVRERHMRDMDAG
jgi:hypothetical protein